MPNSASTGFSNFFKAATDHEPFAFQTRLAGGDSDTVCNSRLINIPTGLGKTAAVVLAWLWNRVQFPDSKWPRRLVYCLPMRTLVEQTRDNVFEWLVRLAYAAAPDEEAVASARVRLSPEAQKRLAKDETELRQHTSGLAPAKNDLLWLLKHSPVILMGGEDTDDWDIHPERSAILIGTQDMLLSRALNRGYGMSRYRWPMHFGLLNNDCLWVMDETQLMGVGVETSAQLDGFRHMGTMPTFGVCPTWWMSATLDDARLTTVDHPKPADGWLVEQLSDTEQSSGRPHDLITAAKKLSRAALKDASAPLTLNSATKDYAGQLAKLVKERHKTGTLTLVVVNRVKRAREIFEALTTGKNPLYDREKVALIHSRFRPADRERHTKLLFDEGDRIVIATQAVEAGVDVSARLLITELAPWSSLVQRTGRCNRRADIPDAEVLWVDIQPKDDKDDLLRPYSETELKKARAAIAPLTDASPQVLREVTVAEENVLRPVIRRRDLVDLFDTTPDICGQDLDVSRYIRDGDDNDVQFFWRSVEEDAPTDEEPPPHRDELCRVSIGDAVKFLGKKPRAWRWNPLSEEWEESKLARPGVVYLVDVKSGGYSDATGWTGDSKAKPTPHPPNDGELPKYAGNRPTFAHKWQSLAEHTAKVVSEMKAIAAGLSISDADAAPLYTAALWHDIGKAHDEFQAMLVRNDVSRQDTIWAKSENKNGKCNRCGFRHELASALAWLLAESPHAPGKPGAIERDLVAYLIAAHHGKVRLSIRSLPEETGNPKTPDALYARGLWQDDILPAVSLGEFTTPEITLDLSFMKMGEGKYGQSWLARSVALRDRRDLGPFLLAYLETLLRAADARASREQTT
jgi:CRISPR-associated endonuclease/helicase Cas3